MAIGTPTLIGSIANKLGTSPTSVTVPAGGVPLGARIFVHFSGTNASHTVTGVTDTGGNTYVADTSGTAGFPTYLYSAPVTTALVSGNTIAVAHGTNASGHGVLAFYATGTSAKTAAGTATTGASATPSANVTPVGFPELVVGALGIRSDTALGDTFTEDTDTTGGSWVSNPGGGVGTTGGSLITNMTLRGGYKITTASGVQTYNPAITSRTWQEVIASYAETAGAAAKAFPFLSRVGRNPLLRR